MIIRATSDLHLTEATAPFVFGALDQLREDAQRNGGVTVLVGDIFDQPVSMHMPTFNRLRRTLVQWPGDVYVLAGNHDQYSGHESCLEGLEGGSCRVVSTTRWSLAGPMIPYVHPSRFRDALEEVQGKRTQEQRPRILWCHVGFRGSYMNAMTRDRDGVDVRDIPAGYVVVAGHYHMPQSIGRIVYCGSPYETTAAEEGQRKGWLRWDDAIANPVPYRVAFRDVGAPKHYTIAWDPSEGPPQVPQHVAGRDRVRVRTNATRTAARREQEQLVKVGLEGVPVLARPDEGSARGVVAVGAGPEDAVSQFIVSRWGSRAQSMQDFAQEHQLWQR
jgi:DNA repair exonuclease SbcCD nuclease subunit